MYFVVDDAGAVARRSAGWIAEAIREAVQRTGACALALAGGNTPRRCYERLPALPGVPWDRVEFFFGDERAVPQDSPDSNYRMAWETFLSKLPPGADRIHRMEVERADLVTIAREYEALLPAALDILILGIGPDGHTASLFPHSPALAERDRLVVPVTGGEPLVQRLTITPPVIERAARILVMATGSAKAEAVARALEGGEDRSATPAALARNGTWILDRDAAAGLRSPPGPVAEA
jgi:6-phosphogluconolactonase